MNLLHSDGRIGSGGTAERLQMATEHRYKTLLHVSQINARAGHGTQKSKGRAARQIGGSLYTTSTPGLYTASRYMYCSRTVRC